jgi:hypothetical protein
MGIYGELPDDQPLLAIRKVLSSTPELAASLPADAAELVRDCLAEGTARLATAAEVADRLAQLSR